MIRHAQTHSFDVEMAMTYGVECAILLNIITDNAIVEVTEDDYHIYKIAKSTITKKLIYFEAKQIDDYLIKLVNDNGFGQWHNCDHTAEQLEIIVASEYHTENQDVITIDGEDNSDATIDLDSIKPQNNNLETQYNNLNIKTKIDANWMPCEETLKYLTTHEGISKTHINSELYPFKRYYLDSPNRAYNNSWDNKFINWIKRSWNNHKLYEAKNNGSKYGPDYD